MDPGAATVLRGPGDVGPVGDARASALRMWCVLLPVLFQMVKGDGLLAFFHGTHICSRISQNKMLVKSEAEELLWAGTY